MNLVSRIQDLLLEHRIAIARRAMLQAGSRDEQRAHASRMCELIRSRSAAQVARMERRGGLL